MQDLRSQEKSIIFIYLIAHACGDGATITLLEETIISLET